MEPKVIVIVGATCSGKTNLGIILSKKINGEIVSADSRQIYKYLDIGTAKPTLEQLKETKHHFIDILDPTENYNVSRFQTDAAKKIREIISAGKVPAVVGGSGLYIKGLVDGIFDSVDKDEEYRSELMEMKRIYGNEYLYKQLQKVDEETASKLLPQNWKRVMRALEVYRLSGRSISRHQAEHTRTAEFNFIQFGLEWDRDILYQNINSRVDKMIESGLIKEAKLLLEKGFSKASNALNTVGYKEIISYLDGIYTLEQAIDLIKRNTRRYAKRQMTWFRADKRITWFHLNSQEELESISERIIDEFRR